MDEEDFPCSAGTHLALPRCLLELGFGLLARCPVPGGSSLPSVVAGQATFGAGIPNFPLITEGELLPISARFGDPNPVQLSPGIEQRIGVWAKRSQRRSLEICSEPLAGAAPGLRGPQPIL